MCPGHERALPIESTVMSLDVREEGKNRTTFWEGKGDRATITILFVSLNEQIWTEKYRLCTVYYHEPVFHFWFRSYEQKRLKFLLIDLFNLKLIFTIHWPKICKLSRWLQKSLQRLYFVCSLKHLAVLPGATPVEVDREPSVHIRHVYSAVLRGSSSTAASGEKGSQYCELSCIP